MSKATDTVYRVVRLSEDLVSSLRAARDARGQTNQEFVENAVNKQLPQLTTGLRELGLVVVEGQTKAVRLPFSDESGTLAALKDASEEIGVPIVRLLTMCLSLELRTPDPPKRRRGRPKGSRNKKAPQS